jgi:hypothetical protein
MYWRTGSPQFEAGLFLDAAQRADRHVSLRMRNSDSSGLHGMLELDVAAPLGHLTPTVILKRLDNLAEAP